MQEKELKILLKKEEYFQLIQDLSLHYQKSLQLQENHYFDTKDYQYLKKREMLRIRKTKDATILTIKRN
ncbi:CYTH domain-containing protein, partial [bacterium]|nr:CYTH domain-containing protein [bacterium]